MKAVKPAVILVLCLASLTWSAPARAQNSTVPFKVYITELWQLDDGMDPVIGVIADFYAKVTINGVEQSNQQGDEGACDSTTSTGILVPFRMFKNFDRISECKVRTPWTFTQNVPAGQSVHVKIQIFDKDTFSDDEADLKEGEGATP